MLPETVVEKLESMSQRHAELTRDVANPEVCKSPARYQRCARELAAVTKTVARFQKYQAVEHQIEGATTVLAESEDDEELRALAEEELESLGSDLAKAEQDILNRLVEEDEDSQKNAIVEIRAGTGGEEASLFAADLFRMYSKYAEQKGWKLEAMDTHESDLRGLREIVFSVAGSDVYKLLRYEAGTHRVQRVPVTEASGRIHTSAATVAVLPEAEEVDIQIEAKDLKVDRFCSTGPGGQSVNTTYSAVRVTHVPTNTVVSCQDEKSQHKNLAKAMRVLRSRVYDQIQRQVKSERDQVRRGMVGSGDRSEKIRTYNFPQNRVTDHRINFTSHGLQEILGGDLDGVTSRLREHDRMERIKQL